MKKVFQFLTLFVAGLAGLHAAPPPAHSAKAERTLLVDSCSMPVAQGKATLMIGLLQRTNGVYSGDYKIKIFPYFFKNEKGRLAIIVSDAALARVNQGKTAVIAGTATSSRKGGKTRQVEANATPIDLNHGTLKLWFVAGDTLMTFETAYHFTPEGPEGPLATKEPVNHPASKFP